jgi:hypothetical protein
LSNIIRKPKTLESHTYKRLRKLKRKKLSLKLRNLKKRIYQTAPKVNVTVLHQKEKKLKRVTKNAKIVQVLMRLRMNKTITKCFLKTKSCNYKSLMSTS